MESTFSVPSRKKCTERTCCFNDPSLQYVCSSNFEKYYQSIDKCLRKFWWGEQDNIKQIHTIKWSHLCKPICEGGLRIKDTKTTIFSSLGQNMLEIPSKL